MKKTPQLITHCNEMKISALNGSTSLLLIIIIDYFLSSFNISYFLSHLTQVIISPTIELAQLSRAVEYTDCFSAEV